MKTEKELEYATIRVNGQENITGGGCYTAVLDRRGS